MRSILLFTISYNGRRLYDRPVRARAVRLEAKAGCRIADSCAMSRSDEPTGGNRRPLCERAERFRTTFVYPPHSHPKHQKNFRGRPACASPPSYVATPFGAFTLSCCWASGWNQKIPGRNGRRRPKPKEARP